MWLNLRRIYVYGNVHIAICAAIFALGGLAIDNGLMPISFTEKVYVFFVFSATLFGYNLHRMYGKKYIHAALGYRYEIFEHFPRSGLAATIIALVFCFASFNLLSFTYQVGIVMLGLLTLGYILPLGGMRIRDIAWLKIISVGMVWSGVFILPYASSIGILDMKASFIFIEKTCFIIALTIPFEWRDQKMDESAGIRTLGTINRSLSKKLMLSLMVVSVIFVMLSFLYCSYSLSLAIALPLLYTFQYVATIVAEGKSEYYHLVFLDGIIALQGIIHLYVD